MLNLVLALAISQPAPIYSQDPDTITNPGLKVPFSEPQNIEGLLLTAPAELKKLPGDNPTYTAYQASVSTVEGTGSGITQIVTVVVTDLDKLESKPIPEQICNLHDQASRTRVGFAGQLFKSERTEVNGRPMVVILGSMTGRDNNQKAINIYHVSAALSNETKAYEITWYTYHGGDVLTNAIKSVRSAALADGERTHTPKKLFGTSGYYNLLGTPYKFQLPKPTLALPDQEPITGQSGLYVGEVSDEGWYATIEIAEIKEPIGDYSPSNLLKLLGYPEWADLKPDFELSGYIQVCSDLAISEDRHARIDIAGNGSRIYAVIVSAAKDKPLPARSVVGLFQ